MKEYITDNVSSHAVDKCLAAVVALVEKIYSIHKFLQ